MLSTEIRTELHKNFVSLFKNISRDQEVPGLQNLIFVSGITM